MITNEPPQQTGKRVGRHSRVVPSDMDLTSAAASAISATIQTAKDKSLQMTPISCSMHGMIG